MKVSRSKPGELGDGPAEIAEVCPARGIAPRVDGLPDEHDLARTELDSLARFGQDRILRPVIEPTAHVRNDTERTIVRATSLDRHERAQVRERIGDAIGRAAESETHDIVLLAILRRAREHLAGRPGGELIAQLHQLARSEDRVDVRRAPAHRLVVLLGETPRDHQTHARVAQLERLEVIHAPVSAALGVVAYRAGIEDNNVRLFRRGSHVVPGRARALGNVA